MKKSFLIIIISVLAILNSSYLLFLHFSHDTYFCDPSEAFNCGAVNKSEYSTLDGPINHILGTDISLPIPTALIAIIAFLGIILLSLQIYYDKFIISKKLTILKLKSILTISFIFVLYLIYVEAFVLHAWCLYCLTLDALIILALILSFSKKLN